MSQLHAFRVARQPKNNGRHVRLNAASSSHNFGACGLASGFMFRSQNPFASLKCWASWPPGISSIASRFFHWVYHTVIDPDRADRLRIKLENDEHSTLTNWLVQLTNWLVLSFTCCFSNLIFDYYPQWTPILGKG